MKYVKHPEFNLIQDTLFAFIDRLNGFNQKKYMKESLPEIKSKDPVRIWKAIVKFNKETNC